MHARVAGFLEQARTLTAARRFAEAEGFERQARSVAEELPQPAVDMAEILEQTAERLTRQGDADGADAALSQAIEVHERLGTTTREVYELHYMRALLSFVAERRDRALSQVDAAIAFAELHLGQSFQPLARAHELRERCVTEGTVPSVTTPAFEDVLAELDELIGLAAVKEQVRAYASFVRIQKLRAAAGHRTPELTFHLSFEGPPGTGKTTVARLFGKLLHSLGALERGHLVETSRSGLVAGYVGQTAPLVDKVADSALDGVLFIDEAYALAPAGSAEDFGDEAVSQLLVRMENDRERLAVVLAGYPEPMEQLLSSNPGLESRIAERIPFPHYEPAELAAIFRHFVEESDYDLSEAASRRVDEIAAQLHANRDERFGNARAMRNLFDDAVAAHASRLVAAGVESGPALNLLEPADLDAAASEQ